MRGVELVLLCLASYRLARLLIDDTILQPVRDALFRRCPGENVEYQPKDQGMVRGGTIIVDGKIFAAEPTWLGDRLAALLSCYACTGFWTSLLLVAGYYLSPTLTFWLAAPLAVSAAVWLLAVVAARLDEQASD